MRPTEPQHDERGEQRQAGAVVLVVEDDPEINELERQLLAASGLESVGVLAGDEALAAVARRDFSAVLLDLMLPGMDGFETCRRLRRQRGRACGASAYFTKPFDPDEVIAALWELIRSRGAGASSNGEPGNGR